MTKKDNVSKYFNGLCVLDQAAPKIAEASNSESKVQSVRGKSISPGRAQTLEKSDFGKVKSTPQKCSKPIEKPDSRSVICDRHFNWLGIIGLHELFNSTKK